MPIITLPDGNNLTFPDKVTGLDVAEKISKSLAKQAMIISVDGELKDLDFLIKKDCSIKIYTSKKYILKNIAKLLLLYSLLNIILFNILGLINNNNFTKLYCIITIIFIIIILNYIYNII
mgnify:CR=1 FL=1